MKKILILVLAIFLMLEVYGQGNSKVTVKWGEGYSLELRRQTVNLIGKQGNYTYGIQGVVTDQASLSASKLYLHRYNENMDLDKSIPLKLRYKGEKLNYEDAFFFNNVTRPKNILENRKRGLVPDIPREWALTLVTIDEDGQWEREILLMNKDENIITKPKICRQVNDKEMIIYGKFMRTNKVGYIKFK